MSDSTELSTSSVASSTSKMTSKLSGVATDVIVAAGNIAALEVADDLSKERDKKYLSFEESSKTQAQLDYEAQFKSDRLTKAALIPRSGENASTIRFMFNPTDLQFSRGVSIEMVKGARTFRGLPKVNFGFIEPYQIKLAGLIFDTYETGEDVYDLIKPLRDAVDFSSFRDPFQKQSGSDYSERSIETSITNVGLNTAASSLASAYGLSVNATGLFEYGVDLSSQPLEMRRPPVYYFMWGPHNYMLCMIKDLSFKLTMFLPNGTPVRALVDLSLEEVDLGVASQAFSDRQDIISKK
jgi:hypothetical protein